MRILAVSDIHTNLSCINKLRAYESNRFDAVVVAGDMGSEIAGPLLRVLTTFGCPVAYVYGNWDNKLEYDVSFTSAARHLHLKPIQVSGFTFAGFSGCPTHWGRNPSALQAQGAVDRRHRSILARLDVAERHFERAKRLINARYDQEMAELERKTKDRRRRRYKDRVAALRRWRERDIDRAGERIDSVKRTRAFQAYLYDARAAEKETLGQNRSAMIQQVSDLGVSPDSLILVTHERLTHLNDHCPSAFMHLYGHIHGFAHSNYKGTHFVNVSVLDRLAGMVPDSPVERSDTLCNANAGTYTIIEIGREATTVTSHQLPIDYLGWTKAAFAVIGSPLVPEEATFGFYRAFMTESTEPQ